MNEFLQDASRSPERAEYARLLRTIDNYVWKSSDVREALLEAPFIKPSFQAKIGGVDGLWDLFLDKKGTVYIKMKENSYGLSKKPNGGYEVVVRKGQEETVHDAASPAVGGFLKALEDMLNAYAAQIEQGMRTNEAKRRLRDTILRRRSPK